MRLRPLALFLCAALSVAGSAAAPQPAAAGPLTLKQVSEALAKAAPGRPPDLAHQDLGDLDLSDLDFKHANLAGANLYGANLSRANLSGTDLSGAVLDHATITRTNFSNAKLANASLFDIAAFSSLEPAFAEAPNFAGADLSGTTIVARLTGTDLHGANLTRARLGAPRDQLLTPFANDFSSCNLSGAKLTGADIHGMHLAFARFVGADLSGANLSRTDLAHADLTGANLTGADLTGADLDGTILRQVKGLSDAKGLDHARHRDKAVY